MSDTKQFTFPYKNGKVNISVSANLAETEDALRDRVADHRGFIETWLSTAFVIQPSTTSEPAEPLPFTVSSGVKAGEVNLTVEVAGTSQVPSSYFDIGADEILLVFSRDISTLARLLISKLVPEVHSVYGQAVVAPSS